MHTCSLDAKLIKCLQNPFHASFRWLSLLGLLLGCFLGCLLSCCLLRCLSCCRLRTRLRFLLISRCSCWGLLFRCLGWLLLLRCWLLLLCGFFGLLFQYWVGFFDGFAGLCWSGHYGLDLVLLLFFLEIWLLLLLSLRLGTRGISCLHVSWQLGSLDWLLFPGLGLNLAGGLELIRVYVGVLLNSLSYLSTALSQSLIMWPETRKALRENQLKNREMLVITICTNFLLHFVFVTDIRLIPLKK